MEKITSFTINHLDLEPGVYVSRKDRYGDAVITTFDLRMTAPNREPVMNTAEMHTIEHLGATFLRNHPVFADKTVYFGPMGCRTGFYMLLAGSAGRSPAPRPGTAATGWTRTSEWRTGLLTGILRARWSALTRLISFIPTKIKTYILRKVAPICSRNAA